MLPPLMLLSRWMILMPELLLLGLWPIPKLPRLRPPGRLPPYSLDRHLPRPLCILCPCPSLAVSPHIHWPLRRAVPWQCLNPKPRPPLLTIMSTRLTSLSYMRRKDDSTSSGPTLRSQSIVFSRSTEPHRRKSSISWKTRLCIVRSN